MIEATSPSQSTTETSPRTYRARDKILELIKTDDYSYRDVQKIVGGLFPRKFYKGKAFSYIVDRIIHNNVLPKLGDKDRVALSKRKAEYEENLRRLVREDELTKVYTRRYFFEKYGELFQGRQKHRLLMIDLDHFKSCNDNYGHNKGDEVLRAFGSLLNETFGSDSFVGRYGGEEFAVAVPESVTDPDERLTTLRDKYKDYVSPLYTKSDSLFRGHLSAGIYDVDFSDPNESVETAVRKADTALNIAKGNTVIPGISAEGRNRTVSWNDTFSATHPAVLS